MEELYSPANTGNIISPIPKSQADCGEGTTFYTPPPRPDARIAPRCVSNNICEDKWSMMSQYGSNLGSKSKEEYIKTCKAEYGIKETIPTEKPKEIVEKVTTALKPQTEEAEYRTWIVATIIGVGLYLILSNKSAQ